MWKLSGSSFRVLHVTGIRYTMVWCTRGDYSKLSWLHITRCGCGQEDSHAKQYKCSTVKLVLNQLHVMTAVTTLSPPKNTTKVVLSKTLTLPTISAERLTGQSCECMRQCKWMCDRSRVINKEKPSQPFLDLRFSRHIKMNEKMRLKEGRGS